MSEFITVQVGQCGNQIGQAFWPHALREYGLIGNCDKKKPLPYQYCNSFFYNPDGLPFSSLEDMKRCNIKARALLVDMEDSVVERFQTCNLRNLFDRTCTLSSYPGSGNNWAVGHFTHGREQRETFLEMVQSSVEKCDSPGGFISMFSLSGGTGSGLGSAIVEMLAEEYPEISRLVCCVHPGENQDVVTAPYNIALCLSKLKEYASVVLPVDNKVLLEMGSRLHMTKDMKWWKPYQNINSIVVKLLLNTTRRTDVFVDLCTKSNQLMSVAPSKGLVNSICLLARGDITPAALSTHASKVRNRVKWAPWSSQETQTAFCRRAPYDHPRSLTCLSNTDLMGNFFRSTLSNFYRLYRKKAHVHHYTGVDGFEDSFLRCVENLRDVMDKYDQDRITSDIPVDDRQVAKGLMISRVQKNKTEASVEPPEAIVDPPDRVVPPSALRTSEEAYDGSHSDVYGSELGFKHVHFPEESSLVKIVFLPPLPKKVGIVKKLAKKLCCSC